MAVALERLPAPHARAGAWRTIVLGESGGDRGRGASPRIGCAPDERRSHQPSSAITPESIRSFLPGSFPGDLGIEPLEIEDSHARGRIVVDKRHLHPGGFVHGGVWTALGDTVAAWATFRNIPPGHNFTTIELKLNVFAAGVLGDEIVAAASRCTPARARS